MQAPSLVGRSGEIRTRDPLNPIQSMLNVFLFKFGQNREKTGENGRFEEKIFE